MIKFYPLFAPHAFANQPVAEIQNFLKEVVIEHKIETAIATHEHASDFLKEVEANVNTYNALRSDISLYLNWCWLMKGKDIMDINRADFQEFISFCSEPPIEMISRSPLSTIDKKLSKFELVLNVNWKPFCNKNPDKQYKRNLKSIKTQLSILSSFYTFLDDVDYSEVNPAAKALRKLNANNIKNTVTSDPNMEKAPSRLQAQYLFKAIEELAKAEPETHERTRFLIYMLTFLYPRISEVAARPSHSPTMGDFRRHTHGENVEYTYYIPTSKNGSSRHVTCSNMFLDALLRYREHLGLIGMPTVNETAPLFVRHKAASHGRESGVINANLGKDQLADIVKSAFTKAAELLMGDGYREDSIEIQRHSCHSLRHLGITMELNAGRDPRALIRETGHSSVAMLDTYHSVHLTERFTQKDLKDGQLAQIL